MTWTAPSSRSFARLKKKTANRYRKGKKTQPPAKNAYRFHPKPPPQQCPERLISSAIVPVSLQATQADVTRAYNRSITHLAHLLSRKQRLLRACSYFTRVQSRVKLRTPRFFIPRGSKTLAGGSRPPKTGERRGDQILSP